MSKPVVVGVDGSESALHAVRWAADEARRRGAPLRLVHAYDTSPHTADPPARHRRRVAPCTD